MDLIRKFGGVSGIAQQAAGIDLGLGGGGSSVKSIQHLSLSLSTGQTSVSGTISSVNVSNSIVLVTCEDANWDSATFVAANITDSTTVGLVRGGSQPTTQGYNVTVIEYNNVKSRQTGQVSIPSGTYDTTVTITAVNESKAYVVASFRTNTVAINSPTLSYKLSGTSLQIKKSYLDMVVRWQIIEFK
ncbi:hypothetical protein KQR54_18700 [Mycobacterium gordonae]|nr:hypothetical protein [Mycobacterium gordonae]